MFLFTYGFKDIMFLFTYGFKDIFIRKMTIVNFKSYLFRFLGFTVLDEL